jgi:hypothetical protein
MDSRSALQGSTDNILEMSRLSSPKYTRRTIASPIDPTSPVRADSYFSLITGNSFGETPSRISSMSSQIAELDADTSYNSLNFHFSDGRGSNRSRTASSPPVPVSSRKSIPYRARNRAPSFVVRKRASTLLPDPEPIDDDDSSSGVDSSSSESGDDDKDDKEKKAMREKSQRKRRYGLRRRNKKNWFNFQNIVAMPAPIDHFEGETGQRSTKTRVESWWTTDEYKSLSKKIKERQLNSKTGSRQVIPTEKRYQPRPYKVCFYIVYIQFTNPSENSNEYLSRAPNQSAEAESQRHEFVSSRVAKGPQWFPVVVSERSKSVPSSTISRREFTQKLSSIHSTENYSKYRPNIL